MRVVEQDFFVVELHDDGVVWLRRTPKPYESLDDVRVAYRAFFAVTDRWRRERSEGESLAPMGWIYDVREAVRASNAPAFEAIHNDYRPELFRRTPALVVLVKSAAGVMQMTRLGREDGSRFATTRDPDEAIQLVRTLMSKAGL